MESLIHADIFFFVTTIIVIIISVILIVILIYLTKILADIREISRIARNETTDLASDIQEIRGEVRDELRRGSSVIASLFRVIRGLFRRTKARNYKK